MSNALAVYHVYLLCRQKGRAFVLQNLSVLCELGFAKDAQLHPAITWLLSQQDASGRWRNQHAYNGKTWVDFEQEGQLSKWVTLRPCRVLKLVYG